VGVVYDEQMLLHKVHRSTHPERPERIMAIYLHLLESDLWKKMVKIDSEQATEEDILLAHTKKHFNTVMNIC
jgi:acetoin utilization deacetylase AcuC-like enzyme